MAKKITELPAVTTPLAGTEVLEIVQAGANKKVTRAQLIAGLVKTLVAGTNITINATDPENPVISASGGGGGGGGGVSLPVVQALSESRDLALTDINTFNVNSSSSAYTATIPAQSGVAWTADAEIHFLRSGTGNIVITAATGVTLNGVSAGSVTMTAQNGGVTIKRVGENSWWLGGLTTQPPQILGTVSQSGGVPTGSIIERGSNANGEFVKFADGTLICTRKVTFTGPINTAFGAVYNGAVVAAQNYPATFAAVPATSMLVESITAGDPWLIGSNSRPTTVTQWGGFYVLNPLSIGSSVTAVISMTAVGRWF